MSLEPINPYITRKIVARINIAPKYLNNGIYDNILHTLKYTKIGKCCKYGFIIDIIENDDSKDTFTFLPSYEGILRPENMYASAEYKVRFNATVCLPIINSIIVAKIERMDRVLCFSINGPIRVITPLDTIDKEKFIISNDQVLYADTEEVVNVGDYVTLKLMGVQFAKNDKNIKVLGTLLNRATSAQVEELYREPL